MKARTLIKVSKRVKSYLEIQKTALKVKSLNEVLELNLGLNMPYIYFKDNKKNERKKR